MPNVEIKLTENQQKAFEVLLDDYHTAIWYGGWAWWGKLLGMNSKILTPKWWKLWKDLKVWDEVCHPSWLTQKVIAMTWVQTLPLRRVEFTDWTHTDVAKGHLWTAWRSRMHITTARKCFHWVKSAQVVETQTLREWSLSAKNSRGVPLIPVTNEVFFDQSNNPKRLIDPYLLWVILWDGHISEKKIAITSHKNDIPHYKELLEWMEYSLRQTRGDTYEIRFIWETFIKLKALFEKYWLMWKHSHDKFIPENYKLASVNDRYEIVRWLMDTDWTKSKWDYSVYYTTVSPQLRDDMLFILRSLWCVVTVFSKIWKYKKHWEIIECRRAYTLYIKSRQPDMLFSLERKKLHLPDKEINKTVEAVYETQEQITGRCITVSNPDWLYITDDFIVTHNSYLWIIWLWRMCNEYEWVRYALVRDTIKNIKQTSVISLEKFYRDYNIPEKMRGKLNNVSNIITFPNGSQILLREWCYLPQDPLYNRFGSLELTWAFVEESAECPIEWIEILQTRVWRFKNEEYWILGKVLETFNPNPWHVYERYYKGKHKDGKQAIFIPSLVYSNNFIDKGYIQNLERASERTKQRLLYWKWDFDDNSWMLFKQWDLDSLKTNESHWDNYFLICDVARFGKDTTRISLWRGNTWVRVWTYAKSSVEDVKTSIKLIQNQYEIEARNIIIDADWVWGWVVDWIPYSTGFVNNSKPIETGAKQNYANLKSQCAFLLQEKVQKWEIAIKWEHLDADKDWEILVQEMLNCYIDEKSIDGKTRIETKDKMKARIWRSPDLLDTMIMRMYPYLRYYDDEITGYLTSIAR